MQNDLSQRFESERLFLIYEDEEFGISLLEQQVIGQGSLKRLGPLEYRLEVTIRPEHQNCGYGTEACSLFIESVLHREWVIVAEARDQAWRRVLEKLNFQPDAPVESKIYKLNWSDWRGRDKNLIDASIHETEPDPVPFD